MHYYIRCYTHSTVEKYTLFRLETRIEGILVNIEYEVILGDIKY